MKIVTTLQIVTITDGVMKLSDRQASKRAGSLRPKARTKGFYDVVSPIQFKVGETFGMEDVPKSIEGAFKLDGKDEEGDG